MKRHPLISVAIICIVVFGLIILYKSQHLSKLILSITGNYKSPKIESSSSIKDFISENNSKYDRLYVAQNENARVELQKYGVSGIPTVQIYDNRKYLLTMATDSHCDWALTYFFKDSSNQLVTQDSVIYPFVIERLTPVDLKSDQDTFDFYVITYWAKFIPKLTKRLFHQTNMLKDSMEERICFISVSLDDQDSWLAH
jgi:hypothetical protein